MVTKIEERPVLQVPVDCIKQDGDGYYLFPLNITVYVQRLDGQPLDGKHYIKLTINENGDVEKVMV